MTFKLPFGDMDEYLKNMKKYSTETIDPSSPIFSSGGGGDGSGSLPGSGNSNTTKLSQNHGVKDARGSIFSIFNATAAYGVGPMIDLGFVRDGTGKARLYLTFGWLAGMGATAGMGYSTTNKNFRIEQYAGSGLYGNLAINVMGLMISLEAFGDWTYGGDWPGANTSGGGLNIGVGAGGFGGGNTYTVLFEAPSSDYWTRPGRH